MLVHCLDCSGSQFFKIHRHHAVRDTTIDLLRAVSPTPTSILSVLPKVHGGPSPTLPHKPLGPADERGRDD